MKRDLEAENKQHLNTILRLEYELDLLQNNIKDLKDANKGLETHKFSQ